MSFKYYLYLSIATFFILGCGSNSMEDPKETSSSFRNSIPVKTPKKTLSLSIESQDLALGTAYVHFESTLNSADSSSIANFFYDNHQLRELADGTIEDGYVTLGRGRHIIQVCTTKQRSKCSQEEIIVVGYTVDTSAYQKIVINQASYGLSNDGVNLIYGTKDGNIYQLNLSTKRSVSLLNVNTEINGLVYTSTFLYYSSIPSGDIVHVLLANNRQTTITTLPFPDGIDYFNNKIYTITNDKSGVISVLNTLGTTLYTLQTGIDDMVGLSHSSKFLYVLSENGDIYQTSISTGKSFKIFSNSGLFTQGNANNGLEAITVLNNRIYVSYINDQSIYLIDIDLRNYE